MKNDSKLIENEQFQNMHKICVMQYSYGSRFARSSVGNRAVGLTHYAFIAHECKGLASRIYACTSPCGVVTLNCQCSNGKEWCSFVGGSMAICLTRPWPRRLFLVVMPSVVSCCYCLSFLASAAEARHSAAG